MATIKDALVSAYLMGAAARSHEDMVAAVKLARALESGLTTKEVAECKLKAELEYETKRQNPFRHLSDRG